MADMMKAMKGGKGGGMMKNMMGGLASKMGLGGGMPTLPGLGGGGLPGLGGPKLPGLGGGLPGLPRKK